MNKIAHSFAFATLLLPAILFADSINVTFDAALTNETGWVYAGNVKSGKNGYYIAGQDARITSPCYDFAITSIVMRVSTSDSCTRNLIISSYDSGASNLSHEFTDIPRGTTSAITNSWPIADHVRALAITSTAGAQNLYFHSAEISGVPIIKAPTNLQADDITGTHYRLSWTNPENAVSNKIEVSRLNHHEERGTTEREYNFDKFSNNGSTGQQTEKILEAYPDLDGFMLYLPTNSTGQIQLSSRDSKGVLSLPGFESCTNLHLRLLAKHYNHADEVKSVSIGYVQGETTNDFAFVELTEEFTPSFTPLANVPPDARIVINNSGNAKYHRVIIDEIDFVRDYSPAGTSTNLVKTAFTTGSTTYSVRGLPPRTEYVAKISAFDAEGNESEPSDPIEVRTDSTKPTQIRIR